MKSSLIRVGNAKEWLLQGITPESRRGFVLGEWNYFFNWNSKSEQYVTRKLSVSKDQQNNYCNLHQFKYRLQHFDLKSSFWNFNFEK
jgi:hypothetical protein